MSELTSLIDLYDHEFLGIEQVATALNASVGTRRNVESFRKEAVERFEELGLVVDVKGWYTDTPGLYAFDIEIVDRCERLRHGFDHDQQRHEVQTAMLGIDTPGALGPNGLVLSPAKSVSMHSTKK